MFSKFKLTEFKLTLPQNILICAGFSVCVCVMTGSSQMVFQAKFALVKNSTVAYTRHGIKTSPRTAGATRTQMSGEHNQTPSYYIF